MECGGFRGLREEGRREGGGVGGLESRYRLGPRSNIVP